MHMRRTISKEVRKQLKTTSKGMVKVKKDANGRIRVSLERIYNDIVSLELLIPYAC